MLPKLLIIILLLFIVGSLASAMVFMLKGNQGQRTVKALTMRIGLSALLIAILGIALATGLIEPNASPLHLPTDR